LRAEGPAYDEQIMDIMGRAAFDELLAMPETFCERAGECGQRSFLIMAGAFDGLFQNVFFWAALLMTLAGLAGLSFSLQKKNDRAPFWESSCAFAGLFLAAGAAQFPTLIRASNDPALSLTIYNSSTGLYTLQIMAVIALVGMPIVLGYTIFVYRLFKGKVRGDDSY